MLNGLLGCWGFPFSYGVGENRRSRLAAWRGAVAIGVALLPLVAAAGLVRGAEDAPATPKVVSVQPAELAAVKARLAKDPGPLRPAFERLIDEAEQALQQRPRSVLDKTKPLPGVDPRDYVSYAPYFWPNPATPDGLPYIRKDGRHNSALVRQGDRQNFGAIKQAVATLALAYYFTGKAAYAEHAATLLRAWFLDSRTGMNPNLNHAQAIPGGVSGRPAGLIEFRDMPQLVDALGLLEASPAWTDTDRQAMRLWLRRYYDWLTTSAIGKGEDKATNNHGTWYDVQVMALALYLGKTTDASRVAERFGPRRIGAQVQPDGSQPRELGRVNSWGYSVFNLNAMMVMADLAKRVGVDLWTFRTADGRSIRAALDYLTVYLDGKRPWPHAHDAHYPAKPADLAGPLSRAVRGFGPEPYQKLLDALPREAWDRQRDRLLHGHP
jgi:hypothetical protein